MFVMTATNVSDTPVSEFSGTVIFFDKNGKALADTIIRGGYGSFVIGHLELTFEAERPLPPHVFQQQLLMTAEESGEYF